MSASQATPILAALALLASSAVAAAQRADSLAAPTAPSGDALACAALAGSRAPAAADSVPEREPLRGAARAGTPIDTTITLSITDRSWQRDHYDGGVALGAGAPGSGHSRWAACAGVAVHLGRVAATLHNVHGLIHLRADPAALRRLGAMSPDSLLQRSGSTPPAVPPRR